MGKRENTHIGEGLGTPSSHEEQRRWLDNYKGSRHSQELGRWDDKVPLLYVVTWSTLEDVAIVSNAQQPVQTVEENEVSTLGLAHFPHTCRQLPTGHTHFHCRLQPRPATLSSASPAISPHYVPGISENVAATVYWEVPAL